MTLDCVILVPDQPGSCDAVAALALADWSSAAIGHARLFYRGAPPLLDGNGKLGLLGRLVRGGEPLDHIATSLATAIRESDGAFLVEYGWGSYLACWEHPRSAEFSMLRDPSGAYAIYYCRVAGGHALFTQPDTFLRVGLVPITVDWDQVAHQLRFRHLPTARTALVGITELLPGQRVTFGVGDPQLCQLWSPLAFAHTRGSPEGGSPEALRATIFATVAALGRDAAPLLLELSGGLDSSIVASALAEAGLDWSAATLVTPARDGDERPYAAQVTTRFQAALAAVPVDPAAVDYLRADDRARVRPSGYGMLRILDEALGHAADADGAKTLVSGTGGDNVFAYLRSPAPLLDALAARRWRQAAGSLSDIARLTEVSRWSVLAHAARYQVRAWRRPDRWIETERFLGPRRASLMLHPWLERRPSPRPGARAHVALLLRAHTIIDALDRARDRPMLFPLMAQPVMEACLGIPSWQWMEGGRDRAVARRAFANILPDTILQRRSKGRLESLLLPPFARQRGAIVERLRYGHLARQQIIDVSAIERATARSVIADDPDYFRLLELLDAELWAETVTRGW